MVRSRAATQVNAGLLRKSTGLLRKSCLVSASELLHDRAAGDHLVKQLAQPVVVNKMADHVSGLLPEHATDQPLPAAAKPNCCNSSQHKTQLHNSQALRRHASSHHQRPRHSNNNNNLVA
jgi:hypothetical protein